MEGGERDSKRDRGREPFVVAFFATVNPLELEMEISHINKRCIIPSSEANCFCKLVLSLKRHTDEGYEVNVK